MEKASYTFAEPEGRFQFHTPDGKEVAVEAGKTYTTSDPAQIVVLNESAFVKPVDKGKA